MGEKVKFTNYLRKLNKIQLWKNILDTLLFRKPREYNSLKYWLSKYFKNTTSFIVQIGSNDGVTGDPIHQLAMKKTRSKVLLVEPVPYLFEKLKINYPESKRFIFENVAVNDGSIQSFYYVKKDAVNKLEQLPHWYDQLGSFYKENILKHLDGVLAAHIQEVTIEGFTLNELFKRNNVEFLDLLHIDTEGYDWKILSQLDLKKYKPTIILFEHKHLRANEKEEAVYFLDRNYRVFQFSGDFLCLRKERIKERDAQILESRLIRIGDIVK